MLFDTHCHPYLSEKKTQDTILENFFRDEKNLLNCIAIDIETSHTAIELSQKNARIFASIWIHPCSTLQFSWQEMSIKQALRSLFQSHWKHIIAIGETGLDFHWIDTLAGQFQKSKDEVRKIQETFFRMQIGLAKELSLPLVIHSRESNPEVFDILKEVSTPPYVFHCFSGNIDFAREILYHHPKAMFGIGWVLTFPKSTELREVVASLPLENIMIETDSPYLCPIPFRGKEENEPAFCKYVLEKIQELRGEDPQEIQQAIYENSKRFFGI